MKVLIIGGGGRCHAIADSLSRSKKVKKIYSAPGNAGISEIAECLPIAVSEIDELLKFAKENEIDLTIVGPEASLDLGIVDKFRQEGLKIFGPTGEAAKIESSKDFAKRLMKKYGIPTADYKTFDNYDSALAYIREKPLPIVIKYDGLAAGKGVVVALTKKEAEETLHDMLVDKAYGEGKVIIEDFLYGQEFSFMCLVNGDKIYPLDIARDYKRAYDHDSGPNTGGMGAYSPVSFVTDEIRQKSLDTIMRPAAEAMKKEGIPFTGVLYGGLILHNGEPKVIEFNARFGDPETEVLLSRLKSDFYELIDAAVEGKDFTPEWNDKTVVGVVMASKGYPGRYEKGHEVTGLEKINGKIYHMGTGKLDDKVMTIGGRVLLVLGEGTNLAEARKEAYDNVSKIECGSLFNRNDIGMSH